MLTYIEESLDIIFKYKDRVDETFYDTIVIAMCKDIVSNYILLVPNERNHRDANIISNIDGAKVFNKAKEVSFAHSLFNIVKVFNNKNDVLNFLISNSIIIKKDEKVTREFYKLMRVKDNLLNQNRRYLTRRHLVFLVGQSYVVQKRLNNYWRDKTKNSNNFSIKHLNFQYPNYVAIKFEKYDKEKNKHVLTSLNLSFREFINTLITCNKHDII